MGDMSVDSKLYSAEDSVKAKHLNIVKRMSYVDLKKFSTGKEFKQSLVDELSALLPDHTSSRLNETAQCISNAVYREVKSLMIRKQREPQTDNPNTDTHSLSETILHDLDNTLQPDVDPENDCIQLNESDATEAGQYNGDDENRSDSSASPITESLDDSITKLKQTVQSENKSPQKTHENKDETKSNKRASKCCDTCKVKPSSKKKYDMIQCSACMLWYHETCVGISKDDPVGIWFCPACRCIPPALSSGIKTLKDDVDSLKQSTLSILATIQGLSKSIESSIGNLNDRFTALQRQINAKDLCVTEKLESLSNSTDNIKTAYVQKACKLLNKTTAIYDKLKEQSDDIKVISDKCKNNHGPSPNKTVSKQQTDPPKQNETQHKKPNEKQPKTKLTTAKPQTQNESKQKRFQKPKSTVINTRDTETIDLTRDSRKNNQRINSLGWKFDP